MKQDGTREIVHTIYEPDSFTPLIRLSTTAQGKPQVKPHYMVQAMQAGTPQVQKNDPGMLDALAMIPDYNSTMNRPIEAEKN